MKEKIKFLGIIALVAMIGFSMAACDFDDCEHEWNVLDPATFTVDGEQECILCFIKEAIPAFGQTAFYGVWVSNDALPDTTPIPQTLTISADKLLISTPANTQTLDYTITAWVGHTNESVINVGNHFNPELSKAENYPEGVELTGNVISSLGMGTFPATSVEYKIALYLSLDRQSLVIRWGATEFVYTGRIFYK